MERPRALSAVSGGARVGKGIKLEIGVEKLRPQRAVDRRHPRERVIERALGQRPEIDVAAGKRQRPGVFELL